MNQRTSSFHPAALVRTGIPLVLLLWMADVGAKRFQRAIAMAHPPLRAPDIPQTVSNFFPFCLRQT